ncbi:MAG: hypothetical protein ABIO39_14750, partial [Caulobacteraceae bacterium]
MTTAEDTKTYLRRRTVLAAAVAAIGLAPAARAEATAPVLIDLQVIDRETGQAARVWRHAGRLYVAGQPGARYGLRVTNNTSGRLLVVMSVDGINILTGETAGYGQRGYVFSPHESYDVSGWRKSDTEVAAFTFAPLPRSYAARTGRPGDVGVIGIAAFTERVVAPLAVAPRIVPQSRARSSSDGADEVVVTGSRAPSALAAAPPPSSRAAPSAEAERRSEKLGTAHGAREWSAVTTVSFERATSYPQLVHRI